MKRRTKSGRSDRAGGRSGIAGGLIGWSRIVLTQPSKTLAVFWGAASLLLAGVTLLARLPLGDLEVVLGVTACFAAAGTARFFAGRLLPSWTLNVDVALGTLLTSLLATVGTGQRVPFAALYIWVAIFVGMYFRPVAGLVHVAVAGVAYAVVLAYAPMVRSPAAAWLIVIGTATLTGTVVLGLVGVLRIDAREDPVTGLANRRCFDERLEEELERARRTGTPLSVVVMDLDEFKAVNDRLGHEAGDVLLRSVATAWSRELRDGGDFVARVGGDEFGVIAPGSGARGVVRLAERLEQVLPADASCSMGAATWDGAEKSGSMLRRADQAMYQAKLARRRVEPGQQGTGAEPGGPGPR